MTVKEHLHQVIEQMSDDEAEAEATLRRIEAQRTDLFLRLLDAPPVDDEPINAEEETAVAEVEIDRAAGASTIPFDEIKHKYG